MGDEGGDLLVEGVEELGAAVLGQAMPPVVVELDAVVVAGFLQAARGLAADHAAERPGELVGHDFLLSFAVGFADPFVGPPEGTALVVALFVEVLLARKVERRGQKARPVVLLGVGLGAFQLGDAGEIEDAHLVGGVLAGPRAEHLRPDQVQQPALVVRSGRDVVIRPEDFRPASKTAA